MPKDNSQKKALSPYMLFVQQQRAKVVSDNPSLKFGEVGKRLGEMWRGMSDAEKDVFKKQAQDEKDRLKGVQSHVLHEARR